MATAQIISAKSRPPPAFFMATGFVDFRGMGGSA
jgi:hypothetical protein